MGRGRPYRAKPETDPPGGNSGVECIAKGKAHRPYELRVKVSLAVTHKEGRVVGN